MRAKTVIRDRSIPYQVPASQELTERLGAVLQVVYLVFNEGYSAGTTGAELSREAIRLGRLLVDLLPEPEVMGLMGLMLLQESRRAARSSPEGDLILLGQQDRSLWNRDQIAEGISFTETALASHRFGTYTLQATIAAVHAEASSSASTDWRQIILLYDQLIRKVGVHLLGRRLYETMLYWETADQHPSLDYSTLEFAAIWRALPKVVFSTTLSAVQGNARLASGGLAEEIERLRAEPAAGDIAIGGATLASEAAELGLIDEYRARVYPVLVGGGIPFFPQRERRVDLELTETRTFNSKVVYLRYRVVR